MRYRLTQTTTENRIKNQIIIVAHLQSHKSQVSASNTHLLVII